MGHDRQAALFVDLRDRRSRRWLRFRRACRKTPRRCPLRVVTSSATTTWIRLPRSRARRWHSIAAFDSLVSAIAIRSRSVWFSAKSRISAAEAVPSEAIEWMCTSALPGVNPRRIHRASSGVIRRPASPGFSSVGLLRPLQIGPDRVEDCQPLLRRVGYDALEQQRLFPSHRPAPLPPAQPPRGRRNRPENATIAARAHPPHARNVRRRSGLGGQQGRPAGIFVFAPKSSTASPLPVRSRSAMMPIGSLRRRTASSSGPPLRWSGCGRR